MPCTKRRLDDHFVSPRLAAAFDSHFMRLDGRHGLAGVSGDARSSAKAGSSAPRHDYDIFALIH